MPSRRKASEPRCPVCRGLLPRSDDGPERGPKFAPMCSARCKRIDLATWLGEGYRISTGVPGSPGRHNYVASAPRTTPAEISGEPAESSRESAHEAERGDER